MGDMLDFSEVEVIKENVQPLKKGRRPEQLSRIVHSDAAALKREKEAGIEEYEDAIASYDGPDPLTTWIEYIRFIYEVDAQGDIELEISVLERCAREFVSDDRYTNDSRYLKVWLDYADKVSDPTEIFQFLEAKLIGSRLAERYIAEAMWFETLESLDRADKSLERGIARRAEPLRGLERFQTAFQTRSTAAIAKAMQEEMMGGGREGGARVGGIAVDSRHALGRLSRRDARQNARLAPAREHSALRSSSFSAPLAAPAVQAPAFAIFTDETGGEWGEGEGEGAADWLGFPTQAVRHAENRVAAVPMAGQTLGAAMTPVVCAFTVFEDGPDETAVSLPPPMSTPRTEHKSLANRGLLETPGAEQLRLNPLFHFADKTPIAPAKTENAVNLQESAPVAPHPSTRPPPVPDVSGPPPSHAVASSGAKPSLKYMWAVECVEPPQGAGEGEELSFEELRAQRLFEAMMRATTLTESTAQPDTLPPMPDLSDEEDERESVSDENSPPPSHISPPHLHVQPPSSESGSEVTPFALRQQLGEITPPLMPPLFLPGSHSVPPPPPLAEDTPLPLQDHSHTPSPGNTSYANTIEDGHEETEETEAEAEFEVYVDPDCRDTDPSARSPHHTVLRRASSAGCVDRVNPYVPEHCRQLCEAKGQGGVERVSDASPRIGVGATLTVEGEQLRAKRQLGKGSFGRVYLAESVGERGEQKRCCLKIHSPPLLWDHHICRSISERLPSDIPTQAAPLCLIDRSLLGEEWSVSRMPLCRGFSLQDAINVYKVQGEPVPVPLALFLALESLRALRVLHSVDVLHGDFKPDNIMLDSLGTLSVGEWWEKNVGRDEDVTLLDANTPVLRVVDYGRAIDLRDYAPDCLFVGNCHTEGLQCIEMVTGQPWRFQLDTYGFCAVLHCLMFQQHMDVVYREKRGGSECEGEWRICQSERRLSSPSGEIFRLLLNTRPIDVVDHNKVLQAASNLLRQELKDLGEAGSSQLSSAIDYLGRKSESSLE